MELAKYLILQRNGAPQAVAFPPAVNHSDMWEYIHREDPQAQLLSAGFFLDAPNAWWHGGQSLTLQLDSRPQDDTIIQAMLQSPDRKDWDLRVLVWEACEAARRSRRDLHSPQMALGA